MAFEPMRRIEHAGRANQIEGDPMYEQRVSAILFAETTLAGRKQLENGTGSAGVATLIKDCATKGRLFLMKIREMICHLGIQEKLNLPEAVIQAKHPFY
jgi:hypothetical protein